MVAPTVPLMLILAVPVKFVTVPLDGVPNAPPLTTNAPAEPTDVPDVMPVPPAATGKVPAVKADALVEYRALFAPVNVVKPVPP